MSAPRVTLVEKDQSTIIRGGSTSVGALVGWSRKGAVGERVLITSTKGFEDEFGPPEPGNYFHYTAKAFLAKGTTLYAVRAVNSDDSTLYGGVKIFEEGASLDNEAFAVGEVDPEEYTFTDEAFILAGKNPGVWNNDIKVTVTGIDEDELTFTVTVYYKNADTGDFEEVESWDVSRVITKKDGYGKSMYIEDVINEKSDYIMVVDNTDIDEEILPKEQVTALQFVGGADGTVPTASDIATAWELFANRNAVTVNILMAGGWSDGVVARKMVNDIAGERQDCVAILDTPNDLDTSEAIDWKATTLTGLTTPSYGALYYPWVKDEDEVNNKTLELPPSGYVGAVYAYNDQIAKVWDAPYGLNRGVLPVVGLVEEVDEAEQDLLYDAQINPLITAPGTGSVVWGQRTLQGRESALSGMNVRRLLNTDETAIRSALRFYIGERNTEFVRAQVKQVLDAYFTPRIAQEAYGEDGVLVVCDESNNTPEVIDLNELAVDIYVQPTRTADRIPITVTITRSGVNLQELASGAVL